MIERDYAIEPSLDTMPEDCVRRYRSLDVYALRGRLFNSGANLFLFLGPFAVWIKSGDADSRLLNTPSLTAFANTYAAYETLPQEVKDRIEGLTALNSYDLYNPDGAPAKRTDFSTDLPSHVHSVVKIHPATRRKTLYVNRLMTASIEGLSQAESDELLAFLFAHQEQPQFTYEHIWKKGDLVLWDNRCTLHARTDFSPNERRLLRRMTIETERLSSMARDASVTATAGVNVVQLEVAPR